jgi:hypothetical protein
MQINGTTRDVFYYPDATVSVRVVGPEVNIGGLQPEPISHSLTCDVLGSEVNLAKELQCKPRPGFQTRWA